MQKKPKSDLVKLTVTLGLITLFTAGILALVNFFTAPKIEQINREKLEQAMTAVMPGAASFEDMTQTVRAKWESDVTLSGVQCAKNDSGEVIGYCIQVQPKGYSDVIDMMVGLNAQGEILDSSIISISDTPGIGTQVETDPEFAAQFKGRSDTVTPGEAGITLISGATYSSGGFTNGINAALTAYRILTEEAAA